MKFAPSCGKTDEKRSIVDSKGKKKGIRAAAASAVFLGLAPVFGKQALLLGFSPLAVVALRTSIAAFLFFIAMVVFKRRFFYIYPVGLIGCILAGFLNGIGSILYYYGFSRLDASIGHLLYSFYPLFVAFWLLLDRQPINKLTICRLILAAAGVVLLVSTGHKPVNLAGAAMMLGSAALYGLHLLVNQRVLYEVPAPTVTFYTLAAMAGTVTAAYLLFDLRLPLNTTPWWPIFGMAFFTFFSRLTLFMGVKHLGGMQPALLGLGELLITVLLAQVWLGERLASVQWVGALLLGVSLFLVGFDHYTPQKRHATGWLAWLNAPRIQSTDLPWQSPN